MAVSQTAEYALRAIVWLAQNPGSPQTTQQLSEGTGVTVSYLPKVLQPLCRNGTLSSQRGINGGYTLERDPAEITVLDIVSSVDPVQRIQKCPMKLVTHEGSLCPLHQLLDDGLADLERRFNKTTISQLLRQKKGNTPLCDNQGATITLEIPPGKAAKT